MWMIARHGNPELKHWVPDNEWARRYEARICAPGNRLTGGLVPETDHPNGNRARPCVTCSRKLTALEEAEAGQ